MKLLKVPLLTAIFLPLLTVAAVSQDHGCTALTPDQTTRKGYFATIVFEEKKTRRDVQGVVTLGDDGPQENAFVEVFFQDRKGKELRRVAGCRTDATGRFKFTRLGKGYYTIRLSKDGGYQITEIYVKVSPSATNSQPIKAVLEVGH